ncbi:MAG TPA: lysylphosphatidylglycerol synthase transmembrane domain-containing protein, partial [bacterium]|nr:lysylphosphatidylglycerol synthase transmembrane domain-containing protein [bacterium]
MFRGWICNSRIETRQRRTIDKQQRKKKKIYRRIFLLLPVGVAINLTLSLLFTDSFHTNDFANFAPGYFLLTIALIGVPWLTKSLRLANWIQLTHRQLSFREIFRITVASDLGAAISPTAIGGGPIKAAMLSRRKFSVGESVSLMSVMPVEDIVFFLIALPVALFISPTLGVNSLPDLELNLQKILFWVGVGIAGIGAIGFIAARIFSETRVVKKIRGWLREFWTDFFAAYDLMIRRGKLRFAGNLCIAGIQWTARYAIVPLLLYSLGHPVNFLQFFILYWMLASLASFVPTPGATGAAEGAFLLVFGKFIPSATLGLAMIGWRFL